VTYVTNTLPGGLVHVTEVTVTNVNGAVSGGGPGATEGNTLGNEAFLAGFSADGRVLEFATYLGGGAIDAALDLAEDAEGNLLVYGLTQSADFPVVTHAAWSGMATTTVETVEELDGTNRVTSVQVTTNAWPIPTGWTPVWKTGISGTPFWGYYPLDAFFSVLSATGDRLLFSAYQGGRIRTRGCGWRWATKAACISSARRVQPHRVWGDRLWSVCNRTSWFTSVRRWMGLR
jgi:hypothetical protein